MKIDYDKEFDTLYVVLTDNSNSYGDPMGSVILMRDIDTDAITGITVLSYRLQHSHGSLPVLPKETGLSFERDIDPKLCQLLGQSLQYTQRISEEP